MKKITNILLIIYILLLYYLLDANTKLLITMNFSLYLLLGSIFSTTKYTINKNRRLLIYTILSILLVGVPLSGISYLMGNILNIKYLNITNLFCCIFLISNTLIKILSNYQNNNRIQYIHNIIVILINILLLVILKDKYNILCLYITSILLSIPISILILLIKHKSDNISIKKIKNILITDKEKIFINITRSSYIYISSVILYYMLTNIYINPNANIILSNTFFFGIILVNALYKIIEKYITIDNINNYNQILNKVLNISLIICIPLMVVSYPLSKIIFSSNYNMIFPLIILLFFYIIYNTILNISINNISNRKINIGLLFGLLIKMIIEIPLINSTYRIGYDLTLGSILSTSLSLLVTIILLSIFITRKYKINLLNNFTNILNIIYTNIIYLLLLVLLTLIVKVDNTKNTTNLLVVFFYIFISILFNVINKKINRK